MAIFKGAGVAIVTPMYDNEEVNYDKLEELINMQIDNGTDAIIIAGTTGEPMSVNGGACKGYKGCRRVYKASCTCSSRHRL